MYRGVEVIDYEKIDHIHLNNMQWEFNVESNYLNEVYLFIERYFDFSTVFDHHLKTLLSLLLENVHDHGSGSCALNFGRNDLGSVLEIHEESGGFDLKKLPRGKGGCGYREMKRNKSFVSHSADGKSTFIVIPNKDQTKIKKRL